MNWKGRQFYYNLFPMSIRINLQTLLLYFLLFVNGYSWCLKRSINAEGSITSIDISPDGKDIAVIYNSRHVYLYSAETLVYKGTKYSIGNGYWD